MSTPVIYTIEGNIGSGKSTLVKSLKKYCKNVYYLDEPVDEWIKIKDKENKNIIEKYYENQNKYAFAFQMMAYITRISKLKSALDKGYNIIISERCIYTDKNVFAKMLYNENKLEDIEYQIYNKWFDEFTASLPNTKTIYLKTTPEVAKERVDARSRKGEENIPLEYLKKCHTYHETWIKDINKNDKLVLDGNTDINKNPEYINILLEKINNFIHEKEHILKFDGASRGNPGLSGCGFVIYDNNNKSIYKGSKFLDINTNNYAEYMGLILGLETAIDNNIDNIIIKGDSLLVINQMNNKYNVNSSNLINLYKKSKELEVNFKKITYVWIKRELNKDADELANSIIDLNTKVDFIEQNSFYC